MLDDSAGTPAVGAAFDLTTAHDKIADQAHDLAEQLSARITGLAPDVVVVARADTPKVASNSKGRHDRLIAEGALVHASMARGVATALRSGRDIGLACGSDKETAIGEGATLDKPRAEPAAAALSGLRSPPG
jgi:hypothetical protein